MAVSAEYRDLTQAEYKLFRDLIYQHCGIDLGDRKLQLVRSRLGRRMRKGGFRTFREYYDYVRSDSSGAELTALIDAISTNTTHLFREPHHFEFLAQVLDDWTGGPNPTRRNLRLWSAASSSGEEPYSIAMTVHHVIANRRCVSAKILATDISTNVLAKAREGVYAADRIATVPQEYRKRYFTHKGDDYQVTEPIRKMIRFARYNLMTPKFEFKEGFDIIFCRNVMIYFDKPTQQKLVAKFTQVLKPGGYLLIGHSESLNSISHRLSYVQPTVYQRP